MLLNQPGCFRHSAGQRYVGEICSFRPAIREEEDHSLYFDGRTNQPFVVIGKAIESGPTTSAYHTVMRVEEYAQEFPEHQSRIESLMSMKGSEEAGNEN